MSFEINLFHVFSHFHFSPTKKMYKKSFQTPFSINKIDSLCCGKILSNFFRWGNSHESEKFYKKASIGLKSQKKVMKIFVSRISMISEEFKKSGILKLELLSFYFIIRIAFIYFYTLETTNLFRFCDVLRAHVELRENC